MLHRWARKFDKATVAKRNQQGETLEEENQRLRMYKRIAGVETERQLSDVASEVRDRYGDPPVAVQQLLRYATLRLRASRSSPWDRNAVPASPAPDSRMRSHRHSESKAGA